VTRRRGVGVLDFLKLVRWLDGSPMLNHIEPYRRAILTDVHARLAAAADRELNVGPAGEWLLDNFHVVEEHIREVRDSLPRGYYRELPELIGGPLLGFPRVYEVATTLISHTEARVELDTLTLFVRAFQEITPLRMGELWAVPAMLRLALLESVRRLAIRTARRMEALDAADTWAARMIAAGEQGPAASASVRPVASARRSWRAVASCGCPAIRRRSSDRRRCSST